MNILRGRSVLVPQAEALGMIGVIRSLGRAGLDVHAISAKADALGLRSNFANHSVICPPLKHVEFASWLDNYCKKNDIQTVIPTESLMLALGDKIKAFEKLLPVTVDPKKIVLAYSKARTHQLYQENGLLENMPPAVVFTRDNLVQTATEIEQLRFTAYVKADAVDALAGGSMNGVVRSATNRYEAMNYVERLLESYSHVQVQGYAAGKGAGVNCLRWDDTFLASFTNYCDHETPHTGGLSTLRRGWDCPAMEQDAHKRLDLLGWQGVAMVEYKVDPNTGEFLYIETNARFWAALHLALFSGADFPLYLTAVHAGVEIDIPKSWRTISCCYDVPGEVAHVSSLLKDANVSNLNKLARLAMFFSHYVNPSVKFDLSFPGDRKLYFINLARFFGLRL